MKENKRKKKGKNQCEVFPHLIWKKKRRGKKKYGGTHSNISYQFREKENKKKNLIYYIFSCAKYVCNPSTFRGFNF